MAKHDPTPTQNRLTARFYQRDPVTLAKALLGQTLVRQFDGRRLAGRIVEVEAYLGIPDKASHTFNGRRTDRNASMWGPAGHAYVYFTYGMHHCVNIVSDRAEVPTAVLLRALQPTEGLDTMRPHRAGKIPPIGSRKPTFVRGQPSCVRRWRLTGRWTGKT